MMARYRLLAGIASPSVCSETKYSFLLLSMPMSGNDSFHPLTVLTIATGCYCFAPVDGSNLLIACSAPHPQYVIGFDTDG